MNTFQTPQPIAVTVDVPSACVQVVASQRTDTVVWVRPSDPARKEDVRAAQQVQVDFTAGVLTVRTPRNWRAFAPFGAKSSIEVLVEVPAGSLLKATAAMGRLLGLGELGDCELEIAAGDIILDTPAGSVTAKTSKGDIRIGEAARGVLRLETSMGELEVGIHPASATRLEADTQYGSVRNQLAAVGPHAADTVQIYARNSFGNIIIGHTTAA
ncbi:DUF4097 family beta strand repeat protein [Nocardia sp. 2]|uniref:DUF4097 family beta strand repeat protein n=1 Tax=Nocardia acididurans TaxID=2802282 RepID=A0ABS1M5Z6_9NOCA|nr:DUF4097 family beta strand repeat-containing protein [Nocardia acididurans]MBL1075991.1 DUF4097 family beta strand repeat protein [Nocardia acididurans]